MINYGASKKRITLDHLFLTFKSFLDRPLNLSSV